MTDPGGRRWASYRSAVVDLFPPGARPLRVHQRPGPPGVFPAGLEEPAFVLTACNPGSAPLGDAANRARQAELVAALAAAFCRWWQAVGWDLSSDHREDSVLVVGLTEDEAVALGRRFGQEALYGWTRRSWSVVSCVDDRRDESGWSLTEPEDPVARPLPL